MQSTKDLNSKNFVVKPQVHYTVQKDRMATYLSYGGENEDRGGGVHSLETDGGESRNFERCS